MTIQDEIEGEKLLQYVPDFRTKEQFDMFMLKINDQMDYLKFLRKEANQKKRENFGLWRKLKDLIED